MNAKTENPERDWTWTWEDNERTQLDDTMSWPFRMKLEWLEETQRLVENIVRARERQGLPTIWE